MNTKSVFSRVAKPRVEILLLEFMSEIKNDLTLKKSNFPLLLCLRAIPCKHQNTGLILYLVFAPDNYPI